MVTLDFDIKTPTGRSRNQRYPFATMPIGSSFLVPREDRKKITSAAAAHKFRNREWDYMTRITDDGVRVWRVA